MRFYADQPARRARQVGADVGVLVWVVAWALVARAVHGAVTAAAAPGHRIAGVGESIESAMTDAADAAAGVPLVGDRLRAPFADVAGTGQELREAGTGFVELVGTLATVLSVVVVLGAVAAVVPVWALVRLRYATRAGAVSELARSGAAGLDLLALRALASQPPARLKAAAPSPMEAWRSRDPAVTAALAALELDRWGLDLPAATPRPDTRPTQQERIGP